MSRVTDVCHELVSTDGLEVECSLVVSDVRGTVDSASCANLVSEKTCQKGKSSVTHAVQGRWHCSGQSRGKQPRQPQRIRDALLQRVKQSERVFVREKNGLSQLTIVTKKVPKKRREDEFQKECWRCSGGE